MRGSKVRQSRHERNASSLLLLSCPRLRLVAGFIHGKDHQHEHRPMPVGSSPHWVFSRFSKNHHRGTTSAFDLSSWLQTPLCLLTQHNSFPTSFFPSIAEARPPCQARFSSQSNPRSLQSFIIHPRTQGPLNLATEIVSVMVARSSRSGPVVQCHGQNHGPLINIFDDDPDGQNPPSSTGSVASNTEALRELTVSFVQNIPTDVNFEALSADFKNLQLNSPQHSPGGRGLRRRPIVGSETFQPLDPVNEESFVEEGSSHVKERERPGAGCTAKPLTNIRGQHPSQITTVGPIILISSSRTWTQLQDAIDPARAR